MSSKSSWTISSSAEAFVRNQTSFSPGNLLGQILLRAGQKNLPSQILHQPLPVLAVKIVKIKQLFEKVASCTNNALGCHPLTLQISKVFLNVKAYILLNFDPNLIIPLLTGKNSQNIQEKILPSNICKKNVAKNLFLVSVKLKIRHTSRLPHSEKKRLKIIFRCATIS